MELVLHRPCLVSMATQDSAAHSKDVKGSGGEGGQKSAATWETYLQSVLLESGNVHAAAIHALTTGEAWASTPDFDVQPEEVRALVSGLREPSRLRQGGLWLQGREFTLTRTLERRILVGRDCSTGSGCVIYRCNTCLLMAVYDVDEGNHGGGCYALVLKLGDFLTDSGF